MSPEKGPGEPSSLDHGDLVSNSERQSPNSAVNDTSITNPLVSINTGLPRGPDSDPQIFDTATYSALVGRVYLFQSFAKSALLTKTCSFALLTTW